MLVTSFVLKQCSGGSAWCVGCCFYHSTGVLKIFERQKKFIEKDSFHADGLEPKAVLV